MSGRKSNDCEKGSAVYRDQLVTAVDLEKFKSTLLEEIKLLLNESSGQPTKQWLRSTEVRKMLGVSPGTLQNLRLNGTLPYTKIGGIVFYRYDEIARLLNGKTAK